MATTFQRTQDCTEQYTYVVSLQFYIGVHQFIQTPQKQETRERCMQGRILGEPKNVQ